MHDRNGTELKVGDTVILEAVIETLYSNEDYCNVTVRGTSYVMPDKNRFDMHTLNTHELCLVKRGEENATQEGIVAEDNQC